ncbi:MAG: alpha/beta hydrolase domain-containing protein [Acidobacteriota bacterium]
MHRKNSLGTVLLVIAAWTWSTGLLGIESERIPTTPSSQPFFAAPVDLGAYGFTEEEFIVRGSTNVYEYGPLGKVRVQTADVPYESRILVRRPRRGHFNGVVLLELLNPTAGHDIDFEWHYNREMLLRQGYAWVGATIKDVAIDYLRNWDPDRYSTLHMVDNGLAYGFTTQLGALLRDLGNPDNPLARYPVEVLIGTGYSQTADYLTTFANEFHETSLLPDGRHTFDGYLNAGGNGAARGINSSDPIRYFDERRYRRVDAPLIQVQSESEVAIFFYSSVNTRQPDSETFRLYEIAGGSHADGEGLRRTGEVVSRDIGGPVLPPCGEPLSPLSIGPVHRASLTNLVRWIRYGVAPPPGRWLETDAAGNVIRDENGNVRGGLRVPTLEVPLGTYEPGNLGPLPCPVAGAHFRFDEETLDELYPTHRSYVRQVTRSAFRSALRGDLRWDDALRYALEAARSDVGR